MYSFNRVVALHNAAVMPKAMGFALELTGYLNKTYGLNMRCGAQMFGTANMHWHFDFDSLDKIAEINARLSEDKTYWGMLDKAKDYWLPGSMEDTIVSFMK